MSYHAPFIHRQELFHLLQRLAYFERTLEIKAAHPPRQSADIFTPVYQATAYGGTRSREYKTLAGIPAPASLMPKVSPAAYSVMAAPFEIKGGHHGQ